MIDRAPNQPVVKQRSQTPKKDAHKDEPLGSSTSSYPAKQPQSLRPRSISMQILLFLLLACIASQSLVTAFQLNVKRLLGSAAIATGLFSGAVVQADTREIGSISTSGLIFKDTLKINAFKDPKVDGVIIYLADFERPLAGEKHLVTTFVVVFCFVVSTLSISFLSFLLLTLSTTCYLYFLSLYCR